MKIIDFPLDYISRIEEITNQIKNDLYVIDPFLIAKEYEINCILDDIENPLAFSYYDLIEQKYYIHISKYVDKYSAKILCYHELGHILCEGNTVVNLFNHTIDPKSEFIANFFASCFLPLDNHFDINENTTIQDFNEHVSSQVILDNARKKVQ